MSTSQRRQQRAFSIPELLAILAILAILMAILLPSLQGARDQAARTRCLNNIRQIGQGIAVYVHDHRELPPAGATPVFYASHRTGLLALGGPGSFSRDALACPEGWASIGDPNWYRSRGLDPTGAAHMDYAYWGGRYAEADPRSRIFKYREGDKGTRILVTDIIPDLSTGPVVQAIGEGNHHRPTAQPMSVHAVDPAGRPTGKANRVQALGGSILFSDYSARWYGPENFSGRSEGLCYPPPDRW